MEIISLLIPNILLHELAGLQETRNIKTYNLFISEITEIEMSGNKDLSEF